MSLIVPWRSHLLPHSCSARQSTSDILDRLSDVRLASPCPYLLLPNRNHHRQGLDALQLQSGKVRRQVPT
jgi:hypothetical protein